MYPRDVSLCPCVFGGLDQLLFERGTRVIGVTMKLDEGFWPVRVVQALGREKVLENFGIAFVSN